MKKIISDDIIQVVLPWSNEQYYRDIVEGINDLHRSFGNDYEITTINFTQNNIVHVQTPSNDFIVKIKMEGEIDDGLVELTYDVFNMPRPFKFFMS